MEEEGIEPNLIMLNLLINAFGIAGRHLEAVAVFEHIKDSVSSISGRKTNCCICFSLRIFVYLLSTQILSASLLLTGYQSRCGYVQYSHESIHESKTI